MVPGGGLRLFAAYSFGRLPDLGRYIHSALALWFVRLWLGRYRSTNRTLRCVYHQLFPETAAIGQFTRTLLVLLQSSSCWLLFQLEELKSNRLQYRELYACSIPEGRKHNSISRIFCSGFALFFRRPLRRAGRSSRENQSNDQPAEPRLRWRLILLPSAAPDCHKQSAHLIVPILPALD